MPLMPRPLCHLLLPCRLASYFADTRSQDYTDLQSLVKCLDRGNIMLNTACSDGKVGVPRHM